MTNFRMTVRAALCCFCKQPPPCAYKSSSPLIVGAGGVSLWIGVCPPCQSAGSEIWQPLLSTNLASLLSLEQQVARPLRLTTVFGTQCGAAALTVPGSWGVIPWPLGRLWGARCLWPAGPRRWVWGDIPSSCRNHLFQGPSLFLPCLALAANVRFSLVERKQASRPANRLQDWV